MQDNTATMITTLSTTHGIVLRKGEIIEVAQRETNAGQQYGVWFSDDLRGNLFVPINRKWFKWGIVQDEEGL